LIGGALAFLTQRERLSRWQLGNRTVATPKDVVWRMPDATREGDVQAYLDCYTGALKQNFQKTADDMGESQFSRYLKERSDRLRSALVWR